MYIVERIVDFVDRVDQADCSSSTSGNRVRGIW